MDTINDNFIADITHELKTPVNGIMGMINLLYDSKLDDKQLEAVQIIDLCCQNMNQIISDILDISKMKEGYISDGKQFSLSNLIETVFSVHSYKMIRKGITPILDISQNLPDLLYGSEKTISRVLHNLLSNAVKFTYKGYIAIQVYPLFKENNKIQINFTVLDTGVGIKKEDQQKLFSRYEQVNDVHSGNYSGSGLGLYISKEMVQALGGTIELYSKEGRGSEFSFSLPFDIIDHLGIGIDSIKSEGYIIEYINSKRDTSGNYIMKIQDLEEMSILKKQRNNIESCIGQMDSNKVILDKNTDDKTIIDILDKLRTSVDKKLWVEAEELAGVLKNITSTSDKSLKQEVLRLLLQIRKEDYESVFQQLNKIIETLKVLNIV
jgi:hypothetical protein